MTLFGWEIRRAGSPAEPPEALGATLTRLGALEERLGALERREADRELQVTEATEKWLRYLKRVQELTRRGETGESEPTSQLTRQLLLLKYPNGVR